MTYLSRSQYNPGQTVVFGDSFPSAGVRARFTPAAVTAPAESPDAEFPMILMTGRQLEHWHTGSMTRRTRVLDAVEPETFASLHPTTLRWMGLKAGAPVRLSIRRGSIRVWVRADRTAAEDCAFMPFAYVEASANILTNAAFGSVGKSPVQI